MGTTTVPQTDKLVGKRIRRREDPRLITGTATYVEDIQMPGMHHACIIRSPYAAARIKSIDVKAALELPGVAAVYTGGDIREVGPVPCGASLPGLRVPHHYILAQDRVYFVGHPVAVVVASDRYVARDAADRVEVDYEPLTAVADPEKALAQGAPAVHPEWPDNIAFTYHQEGGDTEKAFAEAEVIVKQRITSQRLIPTSMETRGVVAEYRAGQLTIYSSTQIPHLMRTLVAQMLGVAENKLRVITPEVGGGFGSKLNVYAEEALMGFIAMKVGKPVKWIESRRENFLCTIHGRGHVDYFELAARKDGTILGMRLKLIQDLGAYHQLLTPAIPTLSVLMMPGLYKFQNVTADIVGVFTNCVPTDAYRGAGRPEATHGIERMVDILAAELNMDPAEIRYKNFVEFDPAAIGEGNVVTVETEHEQIAEVFTELGERGVLAERIAERAFRCAQKYLLSDVAIGEHLADQLLLPLALAGGGSFTTLPFTLHTTTNATVIEMFLPVRIELDSPRVAIAPLPSDRKTS